MPTVVYQAWIESERGWGTRPDGYSLHATREACRNYIQDYWDRMPPVPPDEYSRPHGEMELIEVDQETFELVQRGPVRRFRGSLREDGTLRE